jgi:ERCC4-related helicase
MNTLVWLPTGLGKTLIAAVVMYNFHRWYPTGKDNLMIVLTPRHCLYFLTTRENHFHGSNKTAC